MYYDSVINKFVTYNFESQLDSKLPEFPNKNNIKHNIILYELPSCSSSIIFKGRLHSGTEITYMRELEDWSLVRIPFGVGWIHKIK